MSLDALLGDYTLQNVVMGAALLGLVSGVLGCFAVLRKQSLLGDTLSHAALPASASVLSSPGAARWAASSPARCSPVHWRRW